MNQREYELIAGVFKNHRKQYGKRTDSVILGLLADMVRELEQYNSFKKFRFYEALELTLEDVQKLEQYI